MKAILLADQDHPALRPLTDRACPALLPVLGKPLVLHAVESLVAAGVRDLVVTVCRHAELVEETLGDGSRSGARITYLLTRGDEPLSALVQRAGARLGPEFLVARADVLRSSFVGRFLALCAVQPDRSLAATAAGQPTGLARRLRGDDGEPEDIDVRDAHALQVDSLAAFHRANVDALQGRFPGLVVPGRERSPGVQSVRPSLFPAEVVTGRAFIGRHSRVRSGARLEGSVVLSKHVVVDGGARLRDVVVLPHTYLGPQVDLHDAILWKSDVLQIDTGINTLVDNPALLAGLNEPTFLVVPRKLLERGLGLLTLLVSAPLWIAMVVDSLRVGRGRPFRPVCLVGNRLGRDDQGRRARKVFTTFEGATRVPVLRHLPRLWAVVCGDLSLVGIAPVAPEADAQGDELWKRTREGAPVGLISPTALSGARTGDPGVSTEDGVIGLENRYAATRTTAKDLRYVLGGLRALFSSRAWRLPIRF